VTVAAAHVRSNPLVVLWRFSRPHTIIGTALSVVGLWAISENARGVPDLAATLLVGLMVNVAIVGVNQITDVEIDRINKPFLPIAAGALSLSGARAIVIACTVLPLVLAVTQGSVETVAVAAGLAVGALYSLPPFRLKRFPVAASLCITGVRSIVVNLGVYWHFAGEIDPPVWALCLFVLPFSFAIAVLKDVPDIEGDRAYSIRTFTVRLGGRRVFQIGLAALGLAYAGMIFVAPFALAGSAQPAVLVGGHVAAAALLLYWSRQADPRDRTGFTRFYMRVWALFFLEYLLVPIACLSG
jgi:homogentisate phytyltransferase/homogentisate geranylgeranyltransferase